MIVNISEANKMYSYPAVRLCHIVQQLNGLIVPLVFYLKLNIKNSHRSSLSLDLDLFFEV